VSEPDFYIHPDNRQTNMGPVNAPAQDANASADMEGLLVANLLQLYGVTPALPVGIANNPANVAALAAYLGGSVSALLSSQLGVTVCPLNDDGDVPIANLPAAAVTLPLIGTGAPASGTGFAGDYYLDVATGNLWGPKTSATVWPGSPTALIYGNASGWTSGTNWQPADNNLLIANGDPATFSANPLMTAGTLYIMKLTARAPLTISNLWFGCQAIGVGASSGSFAGLYSATGTKLSGSSDVGSLFTSATGGVECPLTTPQALTQGESVYATLLMNLATTQPALARFGGVAAIANLNLTAANYRWAQIGSQGTSLPASLTPSSFTTAGVQYWCGGD
jgi:hypothetical protein